MADFPEPVWTPSGQIVLDDPSSTCFIRDPTTLTGVFIQFLRSRFYIANNIVNPQLQGYLWVPNETTYILIEPSYKWDPTVVQKRPAIFVKRENVAPLTDIGVSGGGRHVSHTDADGCHRGVRYTNIITGSHSVLCIGQSSAEADALAMEVFFALLGYREPLQKEANLGKLTISGMPSAAKVDENKENWIVSVGLAWKYSRDWTLYQEAPILKKVAFGISLG